MMLALTKEPTCMLEMRFALDLMLRNGTKQTEIGPVSVFCFFSAVPPPSHEQKAWPTLKAFSGVLGCWGCVAGGALF